MTVPYMPIRKTCLCLGLSLILLIATGCDMLVAPAPTALVALPTLTLTSTARPTFIPAVADTGTALAIAARLGGTPTPSTSMTPTSEPSADTVAAATDAPTPVATDTALPVTPGPTRTPIANPTGENLPAGCLALHTVQPGESLTKIAEQYGIDVQALARANKLSNVSQLAAGQVLCIPRSAGSGGPAATARKPSPTPSPTVAPASGLAILSLTADPNPVDRGAVVRLAWTVKNAVAVTLWPMSYDGLSKRWFRQTSATYTGVGDADLTVAVPLDARAPLRYELEARDSAGARVTAQTDLIQPYCNPPFFSGPGDPTFCMHPSESAPAEFQSFERGFMIWRSDTGEVYVLAQEPGRATFWLVWSATGAAVETGAPPAGEYAPGGHFAELWTRLGPTEFGGSQALRDLLGWATRSPKSYSLTQQVRLDSRFPEFDTLYLAWPDGQVAQLFTGGGIPHAGTIGPAWFLFTPNP